MDQLVESRTPSPISPKSNATPHTSATSRSQFSIDYILSASASKQLNLHKQSTTENQSTRLSDQKVAPMNHQRAHQPLISASSAQSNQLSQEQLQAMQQQIKMAQPLPQQPPHPNFLYFMCMLLQQQQQQHFRQQQQQQQVVRQQLINVDQRVPARRSADSSRSPMDSLAILARLTGAESVIGLQQQLSNSHIGEKSTRSNMHAQSVRHQPYQPHGEGRRNPYPSLQHQPTIGPIFNGGLPDLETLSQHQRTSTPSIMHSDNKHQSNLGSKFSLTNTTGVCHSSASSISIPLTIDQRHQQIMNSPSLAQPPAQPTCTTAQAQFNNGDKLDNLKPAHSYIGLIGMCILSTPDKKMVLNDIYQFILDHYPYYRNRGSGWRNSVRHNLSLNECFQKGGRAANGKGHYWTIHPANMEDFMVGDFRRRRAQRKVRRWNNMDVPSDESEDESVEETTKPPIPEHFKRSLEMHRRIEMSYHKSVQAIVAQQISGEQSANAATAAAVAALAMSDPSNSAGDGSPCFTPNKSFL